jgi:glycosyltransferase involved in cell wall biosynthesis
VTDERKGWAYLRDAIVHARTNDPDIEVIVIGPRSDERQPFPVHWLGELVDERQLSQAYAAADVIATPSLQDTMPLSAMEAQASGRAVIGFDIGGLPDIVEHGKTGYLASARDTNALSSCLSSAIAEAGTLGQVARKRAVSLWGPETVVAAYIDLYEEIRSVNSQSASSHPD